MGSCYIDWIISSVSTRFFSFEVRPIIPASPGIIFAFSLAAQRKSSSLGRCLSWNFPRENPDRATHARVTLLLPAAGVVGPVKFFQQPSSKVVKWSGEGLNFHLHI